MTNDRDNQYSDELLNAFVDDELTVDDKERIYRALEADAALRERVADLRQLKDLTRTAFQSAPMEPQSYQRTPVAARRKIGAPIAAGLAALIFGAVIGYGIATRQHLPTIGGPVATTAQHSRVLFDVNRDDPHAFGKALDQAEMLLGAAAAPDRVNVRVIAHLDGLRLLRADTAFADRIRQMQTAHPGQLAFFGCKTTSRKWRAAGEVVDLLPQVVMIELGIQEVVRSAQQGWTHIQI